MQMSHLPSFDQNKKDSTLPIVNYFDTPLNKFLNKTGQNDLPQAHIMELAKDILVDLGIEEIYLRGSFSYSEADIYSDIDFFTVVEQDKLEEVHKGFLEELNKKYPIIIECYDNVVDGYGGAGFTLLCDDKKSGKPVIFDLYFALKGLQPQKTLYECPRVYSKDKNYTWLFDENATAEMNETAASYISSLENPQNKDKHLSAIAQEILVVNATMLKHIERGQIIRMTNDNWHLIGASIQMLQVALNERSYRSPYYTGDQVIQDCLNSPFNEKKEIGEALQSLVETPVNQIKAKAFFEYSKTMLETFAPDSYSDMKDNIKRYQKVFPKKGKQPANKL